MYDIEKRRLAINITVSDFCRYLLENVPADAVFHVGGTSQFYMHIDREGCAVSVDDSDFDETYLKDIIERHHIEKSQELEDLVNVLASAMGSLTNVPKIEAAFKSVMQSNISANTIRQYIVYLEDAFVINKANRYNVKGRKYIGTPVKYYFEDVGLRNA